METLIELIDIKLAILIIVSSYWVKKHFRSIFLSVRMSWKIFIWSTIVSLVYYFVGRSLGHFCEDKIIDLVITYFTATSFYELAFKPLEKFIKSKSKLNK